MSRVGCVDRWCKPQLSGLANRGCARLRALLRTPRSPAGDNFTFEGDESLFGSACFVSEAVGGVLDALEEDDATTARSACAMLQSPVMPACPARVCGGEVGRESRHPAVLPSCRPAPR